LPAAIKVRVFEKGEGIFLSPFLLTAQSRFDIFRKFRYCQELLMRSRFILLTLFISFSIPATLLLAQPSGTGKKPGMGMRQWRMDEQCWKASDLNLSPDQTRALELIEQTYFRETKLLRAELLLRRLELRESLTNPAAKAESIRSKYVELNDLQTKLEEKIIDHLVKVRSLLTSEQLKGWCPEQEIPFFRRIIQGHEPIGPMSPRKPPPHEGWDR